MNRIWRKEATPDLFNAVLGLLLFLSPWEFASFSDSAASWNAWVSGIVIVALAVTALLDYTEWQQWLTLTLVGVWVAVSPWALEFSGNPTAIRVHLVAGVLVALASAIRAWIVHGGSNKDRSFRLTADRPLRSCTRFESLVWRLPG